MRLRLGISVISHEERPLGRVKYLLLDRQTLQLAGLVVQSRRWLLESRETIVPLSLSLPSFRTEQISQICLDLSPRQFESLNPYWEYQGESDEDVSPTWLHC